ncbi:uncharacterized protein METZ01_LOCUS55044 [marine metagenome]|uniref:Endonuclease/exonuclease/phosphatase domain-containing protein n=1 Tax=marine metagenome TaxID=408172 RepID=A0A381SDQ1_9ZZZZ
MTAYIYEVLRTTQIGLFFTFFLSCEPFVNEFSDFSEAQMYTAVTIIPASVNNNPVVMTWNIRFGAARFPFFADACGDSVILKKERVEFNLDKISAKIREIDPDIILFQEVDVLSKRSGYINQIQYLLDNTSMNYGCYASVWQADYIASDGIGRMNMGNAILSKYELFEAERIQLRLRTDQSELIKYFYLRRNILKVTISELDLYAVNIHATAFATDDTKQKHIDKYMDILSEINIAGGRFVAGGDLNSLPPGAAVIDFCEYDICVGENFHIDGVVPYHKEGSYFENFPGEPNILQSLYDAYIPAINTQENNSPEHYTHAPSTSYEVHGDDYKCDRKLDYLFTNLSDGWVQGTDSTYQSLWELSDHMPIVAALNMQSR